MGVRRGFGWQHTIGTRSWTEARSFLGTVDWTNDGDDYLLRIIDSVIETGADHLLALSTSMHDLVTTPHPAIDPPFDAVLVAAPGSVRTHPPGTVRIDHMTVNGRNTEIVRPAIDAVPLFWRFMREEFGISVKR